MIRTYDHNGETREIRLLGVPDDEIASLVESLQQDDDSDDNIILAARDRILCLVKEKAELVEQCSTLTWANEKHSRSINEFAEHEADLQRELTTLSEQRAELVADFMKIHNALHQVLCVFVPGNDGAAKQCSELLRETAAKWIDSKPEAEETSE